LRKFSQQHLQNAFDIFEHLVVPDPDNAIAMCFEFGVAFAVSRTIGMLTPIDLHNEAALAAKEIHVEPTNRFLADEFEAAQSTISQSQPECEFRAGSRTPQRPGTASSSRIRPPHLIAPHPNPLPASGEREF
jgi:hypothetical protein